MKLRCVLKLKVPNSEPLIIADDINVFTDPPAGLTDEQIKEYFANVRSKVRDFHLKTILSLFDVELLHPKD